VFISPILSIDPTMGQWEDGHAVEWDLPAAIATLSCAGVLGDMWCGTEYKPEERPGAK